MSISISGSLLTTAAAGPSSNTALAQPAQQPPQQPANNGGDTVKLSESQQVIQLYNQGQQVSQIAANLNLSVQEVNTYLGIGSAG